MISFEKSEKVGQLAELRPSLEKSPGCLIFMQEANIIVQTLAANSFLKEIVTADNSILRIAYRFISNLWQPCQGVDSLAQW